MRASGVPWLVLMLLCGRVWSTAMSYREAEPRPLTELGQHLVSHSSLLKPRLPAASQDPRLPLPTPQDIEAIKKVAQILAMLGEQHNNRDGKEVETLNNIVDSLRTLKLKPASFQRQKYVIPAILGDSAPHSNPSPPAEEIPNDPVEA